MKKESVDRITHMYECVDKTGQEEYYAKKYFTS